MEIVAKSQSVGIAPRKIRLIVDAIRKMSLDQALNTLSTVNKRGTRAIYKTLKSALANARNLKMQNQENLFIKSIEVSEGSFLKRARPSTRGRTHPYKKRTSHIKIVLEEKNGTKS